ncbi:MAG TPA: hypothetical protein VMY41_03975 [Thermohalobaculum sp.]|nr:hypothetical protein [Thermohalobaculum sp.]
MIWRIAMLTMQLGLLAMAGLAFLLGPLSAPIFDRAQGMFISNDGSFRRLAWDAQTEDSSAMGQAARVFSDYPAALVLFYEEEISGEAYFARMADFYPGRQRRALLLLAEIERRTASAMRPLLERHGLAVAGAAGLAAAGRTEAEQQSGATWQKLVAEMASGFPVFVAEFEQLEQLAPASDRSLISVLTRHEVAAIKFAQLEDAGNTESLRPLEEFLAGLSDSA